MRHGSAAGDIGRVDVDEVYVGGLGIARFAVVGDQLACFDRAFGDHHALEMTISEGDAGVGREIDGASAISRTTGAGGDDPAGLCRHHRGTQRRVDIVAGVRRALIALVGVIIGRAGLVAVRGSEVAGAKAGDAVFIHRAGRLGRRALGGHAELVFSIFGHFLSEAAADDRPRSDEDIKQTVFCCEPSSTRM